jgi:hypothetical protein
MTKQIEDLPGEEWRDAPGTGGMYQVSNMGRVKSFKRRVPALLKPSNNGANYWQVGLRIDSKLVPYLLHRLVMLTFAPKENPREWEVNHLDFNTANCALSNLEWASPLHNTQHFHKSGRKRDLSEITGTNHHLSRLNEAKVIEMRAAFATGRYDCAEIARMYDISHSTALQVIKGKTWKQILPPDWMPPDTSNKFDSKAKRRRQIQRDANHD